MSTNRKDKFSSIWDDLENIRKPKSSLAGIFDQIKTAQPAEERLLTSGKKKDQKKTAATDNKVG